MPPMLLGVPTKVGNRGVRASHQHLGDAIEHITDLPEKLVLRPHGPAMLCRMVGVRPDPLRQHMLGVELQHLGRLMVCPDHCVEGVHVEGFLL